MMGGGMMGGGGFGTSLGSFGLVGGLIGSLFNITILVDLVLLIIWAVRKFKGSTDSGWQAVAPNRFTIGQSLSAREILKTRYARGELICGEY